MVFTMIPVEHLGCNFVRPEAPPLEHLLLRLPAGHADYDLVTYRHSAPDNGLYSRGLADELPNRRARCSGIFDWTAKEEVGYCGPSL